MRSRRWPPRMEPGTRPPWMEPAWAKPADGNALWASPVPWPTTRTVKPWPFRAAELTAAPRAVTEAIGIAQIEVPFDALRCPVPTVIPVPVAPASAVEDQGPGHTLGDQRRRPFVVGEARITIVSDTRIPRLWVAWLRIATVAITDRLTRRHDAAAQG